MSVKDTWDDSYLDTAEQIGQLILSYDDYRNDSTYKTTHCLTEHDEQWSAILSRFITFLEGVYGYPIRHKVAVYDAFSNHGIDSGWEGPSFTKYTINIPKSYLRYYHEAEGKQDENSLYP